jgi:hypothetical protein
MKNHHSSCALILGCLIFTLSSCKESHFENKESQEMKFLQETPTVADAEECNRFIELLESDLKSKLSINSQVLGRPRRTYNTLLIYGVSDPNVCKNIAKIAREIYGKIGAKRTVVEFYIEDENGKEKLIEKIEIK